MPPQIPRSCSSPQKKNETPKGPIEGHWPGLPNPFVNRIGTERPPKATGGKEKTTNIGGELYFEGPWEPKTSISRGYFTHILG